MTSARAAVDRRAVIITGAGPAGSLAALRLARAGARVALVDGSHPREKPCGGGVTGRALALVGATLETGDGRFIDAVTFEAGGRGARVALPRAELRRIFSRERLSAALLEQALAAGATHIPSRATSLSRLGGAWQVEAGGASLAAPWLLG